MRTVTGSSKQSENKERVGYVTDEAKTESVLPFGKLYDAEEMPPLDPAKAKAATELLAKSNRLEVLVVARGLGATKWNDDPKKNIQIRRRFYLLGQTVDGQRVYDIRRAIQATKTLAEMRDRSLWVVGTPLALYASLFEDGIRDVIITNPPMTHQQGPVLFNIDRVVAGFEPIVAMAAERSDVQIIDGQFSSIPPHEWKYASQIAEKLKWKHGVTSTYVGD